MRQAPTLFDETPYQKEPRRPNAVVPSVGWQWKRTSARRDCDGCMRQQHEEYAVGAPLTITRQRATAELTTFDDDGRAAHRGWYCKKHAELLGWDSSRATGRKARQENLTKVQAEKARITGDLHVLIAQGARGIVSANWYHEVDAAIGRAGGIDLHPVDWQIASTDRLTGTARGDARTTVKRWAEAFGADVYTEGVIGNTRISTLFPVVDHPRVTIEIVGYTD